MSIRVDFYLLNQTAESELALYACRLLNKAHSAGLSAFVLAESPEQARMIDQTLWASSDTNFIPHALIDTPQAEHKLTKICIGEKIPENARFDLLVRLQAGEDIEGERFSRVAELVSADQAHTALARKRYAAWRKIGATLDSHKIQLH